MPTVTKQALIRQIKALLVPYGITNLHAPTTVSATCLCDSINALLEHKPRFKELRAVKELLQTGGTVTAAARLETAQKIAQIYWARPDKQVAQEHIAALKTQLAENAAQLAECDRKCTALEERVRVQYAVIKEREAHVAGLEVQVTALTEQLARRDSHETRLNAKLKQAVGQAERLRS